MLMDAQTQQKLHELIVRAITKGFQYIKEMTKNERLYGFALHLNNGGKSFKCVGNTLDAITNKFMVKLKSIEDVTDYLWFTSEWDYEEPTGIELDKLIAEVSTRADNAFGDSSLQLIVDALQTCNKQGLFGIGILREKMTVFIDSEESDFIDLAEKTSKILNPPYVHDAFLKRFEPHNPQGLTYRLIGELVADY